MPTIGDKVTIVNRTKKPLEVVRNGEILTLQPGENPNIDFVWVRYAKNQHPVMGTEDPRFPGSIRSFISKVGVKGTKDPIDPIDDEGNAVERLDRTLLPAAEVVVDKRWRKPIPARIEGVADASS